MTGKSWKKTIDALAAGGDVQAVRGDLDQDGGFVLIGEGDGEVGLDFGEPIGVIAMSAQEAADFASHILKAARRVARAQGITIEFRM